jgi:acetoin utilization deacetylase AcuC-like enzyme
MADPLAQMELTEDDFTWLTQKLCAIAADHCEGRLISLLEGGYDLDALGRATAAHLRALMAA